MTRTQRRRLGEKIIYLSILSFRDYPKRDVRTLTDAEKARHLTLEHLFTNAPLLGKINTHGKEI